MKVMVWDMAQVLAMLGATEGAVATNGTIKRDDSEVISRFWYVAASWQAVQH